MSYLSAWILKEVITGMKQNLMRTVKILFNCTLKHFIPVLFERDFYIAAQYFILFSNLCFIFITRHSLV